MQEWTVEKLVRTRFGWCGFYEGVIGRVVTNGYLKWPSKLVVNGMLMILVKAFDD